MTCPYRPMEFNVVVELDPTEKVTKGGIILVENHVERERLATEEGTLVAVSPHAFSYVEGWPEFYPAPEVGQRVMIRRYDGLLREKGDKTYRIVPDKSIVAVIEGDA